MIERQFLKYSSNQESGSLLVTFEFPKVSAVLQGPRPISNILRALQALAEFLKALVFVNNILETSVLHSIIYKLLKYVLQDQFAPCQLGR